MSLRKAVSRHAQTQLPPVPEDLAGWRWVRHEHSAEIALCSPGGTYTTKWYLKEFDRAAAEARRWLLSQPQAATPEAAPLPPLPADLARAGWGWAVRADGLICLDNPTDGYCTLAEEPCEAETLIAEARQIVAREAAALAALGEEAPAAAPSAKATGYTPELIPLDQLDDNPWQPRTAYEEAAIAELAAAIQAEGLLQPPIGRRTADGRTQLAFGHRRRRAFDRLAAEDPARWGAMPVVIRELDDQAMARQAWKENRDRRDLTAYEEARAIARYVAEFGWSQKRVSTELGLDTSTISNKLRLLKLPAPALAMLERGELSERQAVALLPLAELPEAAWQQRISAYLMTWQQGSLTDLLPIMASMPADELRKRTDRILDEFAAKLDGQPWSKQAWSLPQQRCTTCKDCEPRLKSTNRCPDAGCFQAKRTAWLRSKAEAAAAAAKLPAVAIGDYGSYDELAGANIEKLRAEARRRSCGQLGVAYSPDRGLTKKIEGHKDCGIVCAHGKGKHCACRKALDKGADGGPSDAEKQQRAKKKQLKVSYIEPATRALGEALGALPPGMTRLLFEHINAYALKKLGADADLPGQVAKTLAAVIVKEEIKYEYDYGFTTLDRVKVKLEKLLIGAQIAVPWAAAEAEAAEAETEAARTAITNLVSMARERCASAIGPAEIPIVEAYLHNARATLAQIPATDPLRATLADEIAGAAILVADGQQRRAAAQAAKAAADAATEARAANICAQNPAILDALTADLARIEARLAHAGDLGMGLLVSYANDLDVMEDRLTGLAETLDDGPYEALTARIGQAAATIAARVDGDDAQREAA